MMAIQKVYMASRFREMVDAFFQIVDMCKAPVPDAKRKLWASTAYR